MTDYPHRGQTLTTSGCLVSNNILQPREKQVNFYNNANGNENHDLQGVRQTSSFTVCSLEFSSQADLIKVSRLHTRIWKTAITH